MENKENMEQPVDNLVEDTEVKDLEKEENVQPNNIEKDATPDLNTGSIGKFKSTESLLNAYNSLQAEFTRKCQKLSELENSLSQQNSFSNKQKDFEEYLRSNPEFIHSVLKKYEDELKNNTAPVTISNNFGGGIPLTAPPKPTTIEEAREVVKNLFK